MRCPQCHYETPADAAFCPACGSALAILCGHCHTANAPDHKFCTQCGQPLVAPPTAGPRLTAFSSPQAYTPTYLAEKILTSRSALEGERKEVTVLFCDVVDSTRLAERLDPEAMHHLMDRVLRLMANAVHRYEGTVNQFLGDGLMALFGAPVALEDHALRAVLAALMIQETSRRYNEELHAVHGVSIELRLGLNTGLVVVGRIGDDLRMDYTAVGDTTNVAARLQSLAEPGTILITEATQRLVEGYVHSDPLGPMQIKGRRESVLVFQVTGRPQRRSRLQINLERGLTPLAGRDRELGLLHDCWARVQAGRGHVVGIVGEAGVGKSRLLYEFHQALAAEERPWLEGHCVAYGHNVPYLPLLEILRTIFHLEEGETPLQQQETLRQGVQRLQPDLAGFLPELGELLGLTPEDSTPIQLHPRLKQWQTFEALRGLIAAACQHQPHVMVLEDLHWLDKTTEEYLALLIESLAGIPLLLITTYRPGYPVRWAAKTYYTQIALDLLSHQEAEALLGNLLGVQAILSPLKQLLLERTEGNPFFLEESVRMLVENQILMGERGAYRLVKPLQTIQVPATVQAVLAARIDRLPAAAKDLLQTAAVIGKECPLALLQEVTAQPEETLRHGVAQLQAAEFFYETSQFPEVHYAFAHALTHEVAYNSLLQERRRALHARTLEAIEALYAERLAEWTDQLAHHVVRGEVWSKATSYFRQSTLSLSTSMDDSFWWLGEHGRALELSQNELLVAATFKNFFLQVTTDFYLGQAHHALGNYAQAIGYLRHNVALEGNLRRERFYLPGLASVLSRTWLALCLSERGEFSEGRALAEEAVAIAESAEHVYSRSLACLGLGSLALQQGALLQAVTILQRGLPCSQDDNLRELYPLLAVPLGAAYALSGQVVEALSLLRQAVEQATAMKFMGLQAHRVAWLSEAYMLANNWDEALTVARRALDLARLHKEHGHEAWVLRLMGDIALHREAPEVESALGAYRQALALAEELGMRPLQAHCHRGLGMFYRQTAQPEQAGVELSTAMDLYREMEMTFWVPQVENALADVKSR